MTTCSTDDEDDYYAGKYMVFAARDISGDLLSTMTSYVATTVWAQV